MYIVCLLSSWTFRITPGRTSWRLVGPLLSFPIDSQIIFMSWSCLIIYYRSVYCKYSTLYRIRSPSGEVNTTSVIACPQSSSQVGPQGLVTILIFFPSTLKTTREESKLSNFHTPLFKIVLYWCPDNIRHTIGTKLKLNKYIFDISIPFCHHLTYLQL